MTRSQKIALDYPRLDDDLWVIWWANEYRWPDARRQLRYLSAIRTDVMRGYALMTIHYQDAITFRTEDEARSFLVEHEGKRGRPYSGIQVTTVRGLKQLLFLSNG